MVNEYFESCNGPLIDKTGNLVYDAQGNLVKIQVKPYTVSGLALYLGISTQTLKDYRMGKVDNLLDEMRAKTDDVATFAQVAWKARQTIESFAEGKLYDRDGSRGAQYVLDCCYGWAGRKEKAEAKKAKAEVNLKKKEFELKKRLIDAGEDDNNLTINIVRGRREDNG